MQIQFRKFGIKFKLTVPAIVVQVGEVKKQRYFISANNSMGILDVVPCKEGEFKNHSSTPERIGLSIIDRVVANEQ